MKVFKPREIFEEDSDFSSEIPAALVHRHRLDKPLVDTHERWLMWLKKITSILSALAPDDQISREILDARIKQVQAKEWKNEGRVSSQNIYEFAAGDIVKELDNPFKRKAGGVLMYFLPKVQFVRDKLRVSIIHQVSLFGI
jgi:hypothetical protein